MCHEYVFLKVTSSELFMNVLAGISIVVKLLAGLRNITRCFQVIYVIVLTLGSVYQPVEFLVKEDGHSPWIYRALCSLLIKTELLTWSSHRRRSVFFLACVHDVFKQQAVLSLNSSFLCE